MKHLVIFLWLISGVTISAQDEEFIHLKIKSHNAAVNAVSFSPSGKLLASGGEDKKVVVTNIETGEELTQIDGFYFPIKDLYFISEDNILLTSGNAVKIINLKGEEVFLYPSLATHIWRFDVSSQSRYLATGTYNKKVKVFDFVSGEVMYELEGHEKSAMAVVFSADEKFVITASSDKTIRIWDLQDGKIQHVMDAHADNIFDLAAHPSGKYVASASGDKQIKLWGIEQGRILRNYVGHDFDVVDVEFTQDGFFMLSAGYDNSVNLWEVATGRNIYSFFSQEDAINGISISKNSKYIATASNDNTVLVYHLLPEVPVANEYYDEIEDFKESNPVFEDKRKGEKKEEYLERKEQARLLLNEFYLQKYQSYIEKLSKETIEYKN
jgi:WD40 repeat protein